eukprot:TRINITY_DN35567_c0_g1_i1.p1 TRINITY_DN35567_c0_g1~~TRINITY_DN35567_c0_g1_i1.p1  ORF type:complete len:273 (-),score=22.49 TRINITY_DN35567_c0_g1_i1:51-869(-)
MRALLTALLTVLYLYGLLNSVSAAGCDISANYGENLIIKKKLLVAGGGSADRASSDWSLLLGGQVVEIGSDHVMEIDFPYPDIYDKTIKMQFQFGNCLTSPWYILKGDGRHIEEFSIHFITENKQFLGYLSSTEGKTFTITNVIVSPKYFPDGLGDRTEHPIRISFSFDITGTMLDSSSFLISYFVLYGSLAVIILLCVTTAKHSPQLVHIIRNILAVFRKRYFSKRPSENDLAASYCEQGQKPRFRKHYKQGAAPGFENDTQETWQPWKEA